MNNFFCYLYSKFFATWEVILAFLGCNANCNKEFFQEGRITVVGKDCVEISLNKMPRTFSVYLQNDQITSSCDPHQDKIYSKIKTDCNCKYTLKIKWDVSTIRTICWVVSY